MIYLLQVEILKAMQTGQRSDEGTGNEAIVATESMQHYRCQIRVVADDPGGRQIWKERVRIRHWEWVEGVVASYIGFPLELSDRLMALGQ